MNAAPLGSWAGHARLTRRGFPSHEITGLFLAPRSPPFFVRAAWIGNDVGFSARVEIIAMEARVLAPYAGKRLEWEAVGLLSTMENGKITTVDLPYKIALIGLGYFVFPLCLITTAVF